MFRRQTNHKIGNLLRYLAACIPQLSMTKALKLLYLIDETAFQRTGAPVTWLEYKVWKMGPVAEELYEELRNNLHTRTHAAAETFSLEPFIRTEKQIGFNQQNCIIILPNGATDLSDFSEFEQELIVNVIDRFGTYTSRQLIQLLHERDTLWHRLVKENNLQKKFEKYGNKSNHPIDFSTLVAGDPILEMAAQSALESMQFHEEVNPYS